MYELSDKVSRPLPNSIQTDLLPSLPNLNEILSQAPMENTVHNIELCITLMSREVTPICMRIRDDFLVKHNLVPNYNNTTSSTSSINYNSISNTNTTVAGTGININTTTPTNISGSTTPWCEKVLTLTRQLSELISWSSSHSQARVPAFIPPGKFSPVRTQLKDQYFTDIEKSEGMYTSTTNNNSSSSNINSSTSSITQNNQNTTTNSNNKHNIHTSEPHVMQYINKLSPHSYKEIISNLYNKDQMLSNVILELSSAQLINNNNTTDNIQNLYNNINNIIKKYIQQDSELYTTGSNILQIYDIIGKIKIDFLSLLTPYNKNIYDFSKNEQKEIIKIQQNNNNLINNMEKTVEYSKLTEIAWKHLKACVRDFHTLAAEYIIKLTNNNNSSNNNSSSSNYNNYSNNNTTIYRNNNTTTSTTTSSSTNQLPPPPELILQIADDSEVIYKIGNNIIEKYYNQRIQYIHNNSILTIINNKIIEINNNNEKDEKERINFIRKICKNLDRVLKDQRYLYVRTVTNKTRFIHLNFETYINNNNTNNNNNNNNNTIQCNIFPCTTIPLHMTKLLNSYILLDRSNKIKDYFQTIKLFISSHNICDPAGGYLSTTAWYCMGLHVLLYYNILPNIHIHTLYIGCDIHTTTTTSTTNNNCINENSTNNTTSSTDNDNIPDTLSNEYIDSLAEIPLLVLLDLFFRYYVEVVNIFTSIITLRDGENMLLPKVKWPNNAVLWRISIEVRKR